MPRRWAFAPGDGEAVGAFGDNYPVALAKELKPDSAGFLYVDRSHFNEDFAGGVPAGICVLVTNRKRRIGDLLAGTYVLGSATFAEIRAAQNAMAALDQFD